MRVIQMPGTDGIGQDARVELATGLGIGAPIAAAALVAHGVELVVIGGCALVLHEVADRCSDLDVVPEPSAANLERLCEVLDALGATRPSCRVIAKRRVTSASSSYGRIDMMVATARREYGLLSAGATPRQVAGVSVPVASVADVLRLRQEFAGPDRGE
jgi:hypothetical protein